MIELKHAIFSLPPLDLGGNMSVYSQVIDLENELKKISMNTTDEELKNKINELFKKTDKIKRTIKVAKSTLITNILEEKEKLYEKPFMLRG